MKAHLRYLSYVMRHKRFVFIAGLRLNVPLHQLILHDWHKFLPSEWFPYVEHFYKTAKPMSEGYYHDPNAAKVRFNTAWVKHIHRGPHHWQHWLLTYDSGDVHILPMPDRFTREMVADWTGAGLAQGHGNDLIVWYTANRDRMTLHPATRARVDALVGWPAV